jgi:hypothetical protein
MGSNIARSRKSCHVCGRCVGGLRATKRSCGVKACRRCHAAGYHVVELCKLLGGILESRDALDSPRIVASLPSMTNEEETTKLARVARLTEAEAAARWASNMLVEVQGNNGKELDPERKAALKSAIAALAAFSRMSYPAVSLEPSDSYAVRNIARGMRVDLEVVTGALVRIAMRAIDRDPSLLGMEVEAILRLLENPRAATLTKRKR